MPLSAESVETVRRSGTPLPPGLAALPLRVNFSWTLAGMLAYAACQWGMLVAIARLGSPERVGQFALGLAVSSPVILLANLELRAILSTDARRDFAYRDYLRLRLMTSLAALGVIGGLAALIGASGEIARGILALGCFKAVESVSDLQYGLFQQRGRNDRMGRSLMLRGPLTLAALALGLHLTGSVFWSVAGMTAAAALVLLLHDLPCSAALLRDVPPQPRGDGSALKRLALLSAPLGLLTMLFSLNGSLPSLLLQQQLGVSSVGIFAVLASLMAAGHVGVNALGHSVTVRLAAQHAAGDLRGQRRLLGRTLAVAAALGAGGMGIAIFLGRPVLELCFGKIYADEVVGLRWLMAAGAAAYLASALSYSMIARRELKVQPLIMLAATAVTLVLGLLLIPVHGLAGVCIAVLGSSLVQLGANLVLTLRALAGRGRAR